MSERAIEAAALAWAEHEKNGFCMSADGKRRLALAIRAYLTALAEDDAAVEKIANAIEASAHIIAEGGEDDGIGNSHAVARAAIRAMGGE